MENQSSCLCRIKLSIKLKIIDEFDLNNEKNTKFDCFTWINTMQIKVNSTIYHKISSNKKIFMLKINNNKWKKHKLSD